MSEKLLFLLVHEIVQWKCCGCIDQYQLYASFILLLNH